MARFHPGLLEGDSGRRLHGAAVYEVPEEIVDRIIQAHETLKLFSAAAVRGEYICRRLIPSERYDLGPPLPSDNAPPSTEPPIPARGPQSPRAPTRAQEAPPVISTGSISDESRKNVAWFAALSEEQQKRLRDAARNRPEFRA